MNIRESHIVENEQEEKRFEDYAHELFEALPSRKGVKKAIKKGHLLLNGEKVETGRYIQKNDRIDLMDFQHPDRRAFDFTLEVIFEDEYLAVINKPPGISVSGNHFQTIERALPNNLTPSTQKDALLSPHPVHRLDFATSGLLIIAKTAKASMTLGEAFKNKTIEKTYHALVIGVPATSGIISFPVDNKTAETAFEFVKYVPSFKSTYISLLKLYPRTGRRHQIRIHLAQLCHPIIGDKLYGDKEKSVMHRGLYLAATKLKFQHPISKKDLEFSLDLPSKFYALLNGEERRWKKYNPDLK